ncbi:MAG: hypothetical protein WA431_03435 [Candidatus Cybelea sp.]
MSSTFQYKSIEVEPIFGVSCTLARGREFPHLAAETDALNVFLGQILKQGCSGGGS